ncbi:class I SAM-dependent methyltransferase [Nocardioides cavernae]|uniref:class I SAM-dependent methyltransferase n=1 Tax=Nocardioides TaxID=1839 RepID=UPI000AB3A9F6|nr:MULTISPECIES: class I SAM-dependent methyltransferase [Nocardioides]MCK9823589.1 class I SAM-dependent methyltransferase [Nocardioides cavernae]
MLDVRRVTRSRWGGRLSSTMAGLNARHPWSHNDHFHGWILARLPEQPRRALDVGCGRGELLARLAERVHEVVGIDTDAGMRAAATARCLGVPSVHVSDTPLASVDGPFDVVTMVAVLHHLDVEAALHDVRRLLAPGGRFLFVGLAPPASPADLAWDLASMVTNPVIGFVKHPWPAREAPAPPPFPVADPTLTFDQLRDLARAVMPGARMRHHLGFRHTLEWTAP